MPTYNTSLDIVVGSIRFPANSSLPVARYLDSVPAGLALISDLPQQQLYIFDTPYSMNTSDAVGPISIPVSNTDEYIVTAYSESGEFDLFFNTLSNTPNRVVEGETFERKYFGKVLNTFYLNCITGGKIYIRIRQA
jgi:hypothetical protein